MSEPKDAKAEAGKTIVESEQAAEAARELSAPDEAVQHPDAPSLAGYRLSRPIGRGAYAEVWRGWQERTRKWVAVKVFHQRSGLNWMLLQREVERLVKLDKHPYIVSLLDADLSGGTPYYVLDLIEAGSLERLVAAATPETVAKTAALMEEVAEALAYVHSKGIIHCDLKPANILMDDEGRPRVADFGQSRVFSDSSAALGTLFYMAPEQAMPATENERGSPDVRWDVYALGATFYSLLTGEIPHGGAGRAQISADAPVAERLKAYREAVFSDARPRIDEPAVDEDLAAIVAKCLEPRPDDRYASAAEVLADLRRRREKKPVSPLASDRRYRARKFLQRNKVLAAVTAAAIAALAGAGVRLVKERNNLRAQLAVSFLARSQLEFLKGNPLRAITYGAHSNMLVPSYLARTSTLWYLHETESPRMVYPGEGPGAFSPDGRLAAASDPSFGAAVRDVESARLLAGPWRTRGDVLSIAFSPDGRYLATGTRDREARVWDTQTGKAVTPALDHDSAITSVAISPDGRWFAAGGADGGVRLWTLPEGKPASPRGLRHGNRVTALLFRQDSRLLVSVSEDDHSVILSRPSSEEPVAILRLTDRAHGAAFSPDGRLLATAGGDHTARLWDTRDGSPVGQPMKHDSHVLTVAFSPDGKRLIAGGWDAQAQIWDTAKQTPVGKPMKASGDVVSVAFSPDGRLVATGSADTTARVWDAATQEPFSRLLEHPTAVRGVSFRPDGKGLLTLSVGGSARYWRLRAAPSTDRLLRHDAGVWDAAFSPDGTKVVTGSKDEKARIWDAATGALLLTLPHESRVRSTRFSPDGKTLLTGSWKGKVRLWDAADGRLLAEAVHGDNILLTEFSRDGSLIMSAGKDGLVRLWRTPKLEPLPFSILHPGELTAASLSPNAKLVLTAGQDNTARLWDAATGRPVGKPMVHADDVNCAVFNPAGTLVLTGSADLTARLWRVPSGEPVPGILMRHKDGVRTAAFSPDGKKMVTAGNDQRMRLWRTATGKGLGPLMQHAGVIIGVAFSPDGKALLSAGAEHLARLWDVKTSIAIRSFKHDDAVIIAAFSPDRKRILTASSDGTARIWDAPWLIRYLYPEDLRRLADRATIKRVDEQGDMVTISQTQWEEAFLKYDPPDR